MVPVFAIRHAIHAIFTCLCYLLYFASGYLVKVNEVLSEVSLIKDRQEDLDGKLDTMKNENEALWREVGALRDLNTILVFTPF